MKRILTKPLYAAVAAIICNILWGSAYPAIKNGYILFGITDGLSAKILFAGIRFAAAGLMVLILKVCTDRKFPKLNRPKNIIGITIIYTILQYMFFYIGLSNTTGTNGSIINSTSVFFAVIIAHFIYKNDKLNLRKIIGVIIGFGGVLIVTIGGGSAGFSLDGEGFIMIAALCFVIGNILIKNASNEEDAAVLTGWNLFLGGMVLVLIGIVGGGRFEKVTLNGCLVLTYLAFLSAAAYTLWSLVLEYNPVGKMSIYNFIIPVSGTILSAMFLKENIFDFKYLISLIMVCAGIIIVNRISAKERR